MQPRTCATKSRAGRRPSRRSKQNVRARPSRPTMECSHAAIVDAGCVDIHSFFHRKRTGRSPTLWLGRRIPGWRRTMGSRRRRLGTTRLGCSWHPPRLGRCRTAPRLGISRGLGRWPAWLWRWLAIRGLPSRLGLSPPSIRRGRSRRRKCCVLRELSALRRQLLSLRLWSLSLRRLRPGASPLRILLILWRGIHAVMPPDDRSTAWDVKARDAEARKHRSASGRAPNRPNRRRSSRSSLSCRQTWPSMPKRSASRRRRAIP